MGVRVREMIRGKKEKAGPGRGGERGPSCQEDKAERENKIK